MAQAPALSSDLIRESIAVARTLSAAARNWALYPPEHPAVGAAVHRLADTVRQAAAGAAFAFSVTPRTLLVAGVPLPDDQPVVETARLLHGRDILQISFLGETPLAALHSLLKLLTANADDVRRAGGPAAAWAAEGHPSILVEQIDYERILEDRDIQVPLEKRDDIWRSLVNAIVHGTQEFDATQQKRLLEISRSAVDIGELAGEAIEPKRNLDGSPLITTQAATVLAVFRHLAGIVTVMEPERLPEVIRNVANATTTLDPHVVLQMMQMDEGAHDIPVVATLAAAFDDDKVAQLLATALARDGKATARLAQVFDTIAPDDARKRRVVTMARSMLGEHDFGKTGQFRAVWSSMETLLLGYDEAPYVSGAYQAALEGAGERSDMLAARDLPPELPEWIETLGEDSVRTLSVTLITDLLRLEESSERADDIIRDMVALLEDLLLAGDFTDAAMVLRELKRASTSAAIGAAAARAGLSTAGESAALQDAAALLAELDDRGFATLAECCELIGPAAIHALHPVLQSETETPAYVRAREIVHRYGPTAATPLAALADDNRWFVQRNAAMLLGSTRSREAVPPLQALLRRGDPRVLRHAIGALAGIDDPSAARAVQTALRAASGEARRAVVEALVAERDPRVVPMLGRILSDTDPFGPDHEVVLDALEAVRTLADQRAVPPVVEVMRRRKLFGGRKARAFKAASVEALMAIGTENAQQALEEAGRKGDRALKRAIRNSAIRNGNARPGTMNARQS